MIDVPLDIAEMILNIEFAEVLDLDINPSENINTDFGYMSGSSNVYMGSRPFSQNTNANADTYSCILLYLGMVTVCVIAWCNTK